MRIVIETGSARRNHHAPGGSFFQDFAYPYEKIKSDYGGPGYFRIRDYHGEWILIPVITFTLIFEVVK